MKKLVSLLLALLICFSMLGCGGDKDVSGDITDQDKQEQSQGEDEKTDDQEDNTQDDEVNLMFGEAEGDTYENGFLGLGFTLPDEWAFYTEEQINALNNITQDMLGEEIEEQLKNADIIYDMYALDEYGNSVNINLEKLSSIAALSLDEEAYVDSSIAQLPEAYKQIGATDVEISKEKIDFLGKEKSCVYIQCVNDGVELYQKVICIKIDNYMANITLTTTFEDQTEAVLTYFYEVQK